MKQLFFLIFIFCISAGYAQRPDSTFIKKDSSIAKKDSLPAKKIKRLTVQDSFPNPKRAVLYAIFPGGGQIYNRKLWYIKLPIVYGALAFGINRINDNSSKYHNLELNYINKVNGKDPDTSIFPTIGNASADAIRQNRDVYYKSMQESYIFTVIGYLLTGLEAFTSAHLAHFDVKNDIGFKLKPNFETIPMLGQTGGIGLTYTFK